MIHDLDGDGLSTQRRAEYNAAIAEALVRGDHVALQAVHKRIQGSFRHAL